MSFVSKLFNISYELNKHHQVLETSKRPCFQDPMGEREQEDSALCSNSLRIGYEGFTIRNVKPHLACSDFGGLTSKSEIALDDSDRVPYLTQY